MELAAANAADARSSAAGNADDARASFAIEPATAIAAPTRPAAPSSDDPATLDAERRCLAKLRELLSTPSAMETALGRAADARSDSGARPDGGCADLCIVCLAPASATGAVTRCGTPSHRVCFACWDAYVAHKVARVTSAARVAVVEPGPEPLDVACPGGNCGHRIADARHAAAVTELTRLRAAVAADQRKRLGPFDRAAQSRLTLLTAYGEICLVCCARVSRRSLAPESACWASWSSAAAMGNLLAGLASPFARAHECALVEDRALLGVLQDQLRATKPCPSCFVLTHRIDGCQNMVCSRCRCAWCFNCVAAKTESGCACPMRTVASVTLVLAERGTGALYHGAAFLAAVVLSPVVLGCVAVRRARLRAERLREAAMVSGLGVNERLMRHGFHVFTTPDTVAAFVGSLGQASPGRIGEERTCFLSYAYVSPAGASFVVVVHAHPSAEPCSDFPLRPPVGGGGPPVTLDLANGVPWAAAPNTAAAVFREVSRRVAQENVCDRIRLRSTVW